MTHRETLSSIAAAGAAAVSALFLGAGTAQADIAAAAERAPGGVIITVGSAAGSSPQMNGTCLFSATVRGNPFGKPLPALNIPFFLPEQSPGTLRFPSYPTGSTWDVKVNCPGPMGRDVQYTTMVW